MGRKSLVLCFILAFALVSAKSIAPPKPCCQPDKFQLYILQKVGQVTNGQAPLVIDQSGSIYYDFPNQLQAFTGYSVVNGYTSYTHSIMNFKKKMMWIIDPQKKTCQKVPYLTPMMQCLPHSSKFIGTFKQGSQIVNAYSLYMNTSSSNLNITFMMTADNCVLTSDVLNQQFGSLNQLIATAAFNYSPNVPSGVFTLPSYCPQNATGSSTRPKRSISPPSTLINLPVPIL